MMNLLYKMADMIVESDAFFALVMTVVCFVLIAIGGFVFSTIIKWIERRW